MSTVSPPTDSPVAAASLTARQEHVFKVIATISVIVLATLAAVLSYAGLRDLALDAGIHPNLAWAFPILIDGLTFVGSIGVIHAVLAHIRSWYPWTLTLLGVGASVGGNIAASPPDLVSRAVHAAPPLVLALSLEALLRVYRARAHQHSEQALPATSPEIALPAATAPDVVVAPTQPEPRPVAVEARRSPADPIDIAQRERPAVAAVAPTRPVERDDRPVRVEAPPADRPATEARPTVEQRPAADTRPDLARRPLGEEPARPAIRPTSVTRPAEPQRPVAAPVVSRPAHIQPAPTLVDRPAPTPAPAPAQQARPEPEPVAAETRPAPSPAPATKPDSDVDRFVSAFALPEPRPADPSDTMDLTSSQTEGPDEVPAKVLIAEMLAKEPGLTGAEAARRLDVDPSYARRVLRDLRGSEENTADEPVGAFG